MEGAPRYAFDQCRGWFTSTFRGIFALIAAGAIFGALGGSEGTTSQSRAVLAVVGAVLGPLLVAGAAYALSLLLAPLKQRDACRDEVSALKAEVEQMRFAQANGGLREAVDAAAAQGRLLLQRRPSHLLGGRWPRQDLVEFRTSVQIWLDASAVDLDVHSPAAAHRIRGSAHGLSANAEGAEIQEEIKRVLRVLAEVRPAG